MLQNITNDLLYVLSILESIENRYYKHVNFNKINISLQTLK